VRSLQPGAEYHQRLSERRGHRGARGVINAEGWTVGVMGRAWTKSIRGNSDWRADSKRSRDSDFGVRRWHSAYSSDFPISDRIIVGMSVGVLVVEPLSIVVREITARLRLEQSREVFAVRAT